MKIPRNWTFETPEVAKSFDQHVREQLPWYDLATDAITHLARHYISRNGLVYDIGCSTGNIGRAISPILKDRNASLVGIEPSEAMKEIYDAPGTFICSSAQDYKYHPYDLAILFLSLMFIEPRDRKTFLASLYELCNPGGAIIVFDKLEPDAGYISTIMYRLTLAGKFASKTPAEQIIYKELSLAGVQRPISLAELPGNPYQWFRFGDFTGYIIERAV